MDFRLPVLCESCGTTFPGFKMALGGKVTVEISDFRYGPCPKCGGFGRVEDGVYKVYEELKEIVNTSKRTSLEIDTLKSLLKNAAEGSIPIEYTSGRILK